MMKKRMDTGGMPEKIINLSNYQLHLVTNLHSDKIITSKVSRSAAGIITEYFNNYYDSLARRNKYLHKHVYEFGQGGDKDNRLFKANISATGNAALIKYSFLTSKKPNKNGQVFRNKAMIMEQGKPVIISPKKSSVLAFEINGQKVFTSRTIKIRYPGGKRVAGSFTKKLNEFMKSDKAKIVLQSSGFFKTIDNGIKLESKINEKRIPKVIINMQPKARASANNIVNKLPRSVK